VVLGIGLVTFDARPMTVVPTDSLNVDVMSMSEFSQLTRGQKTAPKAEKPRQVTEKVGESKPPEQEAKKVAEKPPVDAAAPPPPTPKADTPPEPEKKAEAKPEPKPEPKKPEPKPEPKKAEPKPEIKPDAEALEKLITRTEPKKPEPKPEPPKKVAEQKPPPKPQERPKPAPQQQATPPDPNSRFDPSRIAALLDKRESTRRAATGAEVSRTASLGAVTGTASQLSQTEIDALRGQIQRCWNPPVGVSDARDLIVRVRLTLNQDGSLAGQPMVTDHSGAGNFQIAAEAAMRAIRRCAPYTLPAAKYEAWRDVEVTFDPRDMFRG
jgi:colicin import membrane protein